MKQKNMHEMQQFLLQSDPLMAQCVEAALSATPSVQLPTKKQPKEYAAALYESIVSQQLSVKAADTIWQRFLQLVGDVHNYEVVESIALEDYRLIGLSRQKANYITSIAKSLASGEILLEHLDSLDDEAVIAELTKLKGVGRWTAEMFLIFTLVRPDVFSVGDLGLRTAVARLYEVDRDNFAAIEQLSKQWAPHRSVCSLVLWRSLDTK
jgi:DNA-3-methyladenine glycosylase II